ncbi:MAG: twin-arginine translocation signal domain-containing protein [Chloroflexi bacterium]|nr:twin-arginine translocation signal domain-containing protein [Chloroflexota bacterium]
MTTPDKKTDQLSRRQALKTIAALTGATALSALPGRWSSPVLKTGALPVHAQTSPNTLVIANFRYSTGQPPTGEIPTEPVTITVDYTDSAGAVTTGSSMRLVIDTSGDAAPSYPQTIDDANPTITGDGFTGTVSSTVNLELATGDFSVTVTVTNTNGLTSNSLMGTVPAQ